MTFNNSSYFKSSIDQMLQHVLNCVSALSQTSLSQHTAAELFCTYPDKTRICQQRSMKYHIMLLAVSTVGRNSAALRLGTTIWVTDTAPLTHFSSALPVDLRPRSWATAEETPVDVMPCYYADYVNLAFLYIPTFLSSITLQVPLLHSN